MKANIETLEDGKVRLQVEVDESKVGVAIQRAYKVLSDTVKIDGFRKGKVPNRIIDLKIGKAAVVKEALEDLLPKTYSEAVRETKIKPIDEPKIEILQFDEGKPFIFNVEVEVQPVIKLPPYEVASAQRKEFEVTEEEINNQIEQLRERYAKLEPIRTRPAKRGDFALISFTGFVEGKENKNASASDFLVEIGSNMLMPEFEAQLIGTKSGDIKEFVVNFPPNHHEKAIAGKPVRFKVIVKEIKQKILPEIRDEFAKEVGNFESLEDLRNLFRERIHSFKEMEAEKVWQNDILQNYVSQVEIDIPEKMVERKLDEMIDDFQYRLAKQGISFEKYLEASKKNEEELRSEMRSEAEKQVRTQLVLETIAETEDIHVSREELEAEIKYLAERASKKPEEIEKVLRERNQLGLLAYEILINKAFKKLIENVKKAIEGLDTNNEIIKNKE